MYRHSSRTTGPLLPHMQHIRQEPALYRLTVTLRLDHAWRLLSIPCLINEVVRNDDGTASDLVQITVPLDNEVDEDANRKAGQISMRQQPDPASLFCCSGREPGDLGAGWVRHERDRSQPSVTNHPRQGTGEPVSRRYRVACLERLFESIGGTEKLGLSPDALGTARGPGRPCSSTGALPKLAKGCYGAASCSLPDAEKNRARVLRREVLLPVAPPPIRIFLPNGTASPTPGIAGSAWNWFRPPEEDCTLGDAVGSR